MIDDDNVDYSDCRVMVDGNGEVVRNDEGDYCMLNIKDKSVIVLPAGEESELLINKLLLQSEEHNNEPVLKIELKEHSEDDVNSLETETNEEPVKYWFTPTPDVEGCRNCTELLIKIVGTESMQKILSHKNTSKKKVWQVIAKKMSEHGYTVPSATLADQGEKAHEKWRNIEKTYVKFKNHLKETGHAPERLPPPYFEAMDKVLAKKYDSPPKFTLDSLPQYRLHGKIPESSRIEVEDSDDSILMSSGEQDYEFNSSNRLEEEGVNNYSDSRNTKYNSLTTSFMADIKNVIIEQCAKDREAHKRRHKEIKEILEKQIEQRDDMLLILREFVEQSEDRKRKRNDS